MLKAQVKVGQTYKMQAGSSTKTVRVESIGLGGTGRRQHTTYLVVNIETGAKTLLKSAAQLIAVAKQPRSAWQPDDEILS